MSRLTRMLLERLREIEAEVSEIAEKGDDMSVTDLVYAGVLLGVEVKIDLAHKKIKEESDDQA